MTEGFRELVTVSNVKNASLKVTLLTTHSYHVFSMGFITSITLDRAS